MPSGRFDLGRVVGEASRRICDNNRTIEQCTDVNRVQAEVLSGTGEGWENRIIPEMRADRNDIHPGNCFYIVVRNTLDNGIDAICGLRLLDLGQTKYSEFLPGQYARLHGDGSVPIYEDQIGRQLHSISGRIGYIGDFKIFQRHSPRVNTTDLMMLIYAVGTLEWDPDWFIGYMRAASVRRGLSGLYLAKFVPMPLQWRWEVQGRSDDDHLLMMHRHDVTDLFTASKQRDFGALNEPASGLNRSSANGHNVSVLER